MLVWGWLRLVDFLSAGRVVDLIIISGSVSVLTRVVFLYWGGVEGGWVGGRAES